ncbi:MAG: N-acetylmuramoyl-L-alanine amidase [Endomicrobium sp.]|jgi:N-acetylmuramoyl-L-alanine amidase|nr:N-acetylmuramoyl-L-alanine amidase [Endomicrobium sp.]
MKKLTTLLFLSLVLLFTTYSYSYTTKKGDVSSQAINVIIDGKIFHGVKVYKISNHTKYFSVREIAKIYNASLEWKHMNSQITMHLNNGKVTIKANSKEVIFEKKLKRMQLPSLSAKNDVYIPSEIFTCQDFSKIAEADTKLEPSYLVLNVIHRQNIFSIKYFTKPENTQILIQLDKPLSYTTSILSKTITLKISKCKAQYNFINVNNGIIKDLQYDTQGKYTIIKINLEQKPQFVKTSILSKQNSISIDITHSKDIDNLSNFTRAIATEPEKPNTITTEYGQAKTNEIVSISENDEKDKDLTRIPITKFEHTNNIIDKTETTVINMVPKNIDREENSYKRKKIIVLDAGHGGQDPGAIGANGTKEKDINLKIVYELKSFFDNDDNYETILTRKDDTFIPLAERTNVAKKHGSDLFISIHCNANSNRNANGFEIYFLSENATDSEAAATANLENSVLELEDISSKKRALLENMFWSMTVTEYMNESSELSGFIAAETSVRLKIPNRGVKQANFYVLRGTQMPAVLVESAFLSNYHEEEKLKSKKFRTAIANSIYEGVVKYYAKKAKEQNTKQ